MAQSSTSERKDVRKAEKQAKLSQEQKLDAVRGIMSHPNGRHWFHDLLEEWGAFRTPFTGEAPGTFFNCGVQSCGLRVLADILQAAPDEYVLMMREANQRVLTDDRRNAGQSGRVEDGPGDDQGSDDAADGYDFDDAAEGRQV